MTINCKGQIIDLSTPKIMGILNITPNSFYDGGKYSLENNAITQVKKMLNEGATFIDIGAYSSKPNAEFVSEKATWHYDAKINATKELMENKNHDYGEAWREMRVNSLTDLILQKLLRVKQIEDNKGKTLVSEGIDDDTVHFLKW